MKRIKPPKPAKHRLFWVELNTNRLRWLTSTSMAELLLVKTLQAVAGVKKAWIAENVD